MLVKMKRNVKETEEMKVTVKAGLNVTKLNKGILVKEASVDVGQLL